MNLTRLPPERKRLAWQRIRATEPALADLLQDEQFLAIRERFEADVLVDAEVLDGVD